MKHRRSMFDKALDSMERLSVWEVIIILLILTALGVCLESYATRNYNEAQRAVYMRG